MLRIHCSLFEWWQMFILLSLTSFKPCCSYITTNSYLTRVVVVTRDNTLCDSCEPPHVKRSMGIWGKTSDPHKSGFEPTTSGTDIRHPILLTGRWTQTFIESFYIKRYLSSFTWCRIGSYITLKQYIFFCIILQKLNQYIMYFRYRGSRVSNIYEEFRNVTIWNLLQELKSNWDFNNDVVFTGIFKTVS